MAMVAKLWSIGGLALELQRSERTIGRALKTVPPDGELPGRHKAWFLRNAVDALARHEAQSDQLSGRRLSGRAGGAPDALLVQLEQLAHDIDAGMGQLRAAAPDERLKVLDGFGRKVGALDRLLERSIAGQGPDAIAILSGFRDRAVGRLVAEIVQLVQSAGSSAGDPSSVKGA
jgi:hypothetical protein